MRAAGLYFSPALTRNSGYERGAASLASPDGRGGASMQSSGISHSTTFGTVKNPSWASGALRKTASALPPSVTSSGR